MTTDDLRCPACARLLGKRSDGAVEVKRRGQPAVIVRDGTLRCRCGQVVEVEQAPGEYRVRVLVGHG